jgi:hypothetical protein
MVARVSLHHALVPPPIPDLPDLGRLHASLTLVECMAGELSNAPEGQDVAARAYATAPAVARRRYDALAAETAAYAAAGLAALIRQKEASGREAVPAARHLAAEMRGSLAAMRSAIGV